MNVFEIEAPSHEQARVIALNLYRSICGEHEWGQRFDPVPHDDLLHALANMAPREMRRALMAGFGNARLARRNEVQADDLPKTGSGKTRMGFIQ